MIDSNLIVASRPGKAVDDAVEWLNAPASVVITDTNVEKKVFPQLSDSRVISESYRIVIQPGEEHKNLRTLEYIWSNMEKAGLTRLGVVVCVGGGVVTDIGGFAAATFKRGVRHINVTTTLLGAVDAASGGKTAIDFYGLKNEIGAFHMPCSVIMGEEFFVTLPQEELMSGYGEMLKTGMLKSKDLYMRLRGGESLLQDKKMLAALAAECAAYKNRIVEADPLDTGIRKALNLGHTAGHAYETLAFEKGIPLPHGCAVAYGLLTALILSNMKIDFPSSSVSDYCNSVLRRCFSPLPLTCADRDRIMLLMASDKKNVWHGELNFTLLEDFGQPLTDCPVSAPEINVALDLTMQMLGK